MYNSEFKVTAVVAIRNGAYYFNRLCEHFRSNGIDMAVIDNDSEDNLLELIEYNSDVVITTKNLPYEGGFNLTEQLEAKQDLVQSIDSEWFIYLDVDELLFSDTVNERMVDAIERVDARGFDAINFDEFVFLPVDVYRNYKANDYHTMRWYYFFEPRPRRLIRAFKSHLRMNIESGGHGVQNVRNLYPNNMVMRHFMFENKKHAKRKYHERIYSKTDIENRFHGNRILLQNHTLILPQRRNLCIAGEKDWNLNKSKPKQKHFWEW